MTRPVRPIALVILTLCMIYPGLTSAFQGLYPFVAGEHFWLMNHMHPWVALGLRLGVPVVVSYLLVTGVGLLWLIGVPGLWAGDGRAYPVVLLAALGSLLMPVGPSIMSALALVVLVFFREHEHHVPA
jgi:hypothetical protein